MLKQTITHIQVEAAVQEKKKQTTGKRRRIQTADTSLLLSRILIISTLLLIVITVDSTFIQAQRLTNANNNHRLKNIFYQSHTTTTAHDDDYATSSFPSPSPSSFSSPASRILLSSADYDEQPDDDESDDGVGADEPPSLDSYIPTLSSIASSVSPPGSSSVFSSDARYAGPLFEQSVPGVVSSSDSFASSPPCASGCSFRFPRPHPQSAKASFFVTAAPNHGPGLGHQFGEWIMGPWLAMQLGINYVHTGFLVNSVRWTSFLGFGDGELTSEDLHSTYGGAKVLVRELEADRSEMGGDRWIPMQMARMRREMSTVISQANFSVRDGGEIVASELFATKDAEPGKTPQINKQLPLNLAQLALTPGVPLPILFYFRLVHVPHPSYACDPRLHRMLRKKYCAARINRPVREDLYAMDRTPNERNQTHIIIALHLRCGDSCYNEYRATSFFSVLRTVSTIYSLLNGLDPLRIPAFHIFSQAPRNDTAENHFRPMIDRMKGMKVRTHFKTSGPNTLHHLITADVLLGSQSSFSWLATLLHHTVSMGPIHNCRFDVPYERDTGEFDASAFLRHYQASKHLTPKFDTWKDCEDIQ